MISKKARHDSKYVNAVSQNIIQYILEGIITKQIKQEDITNEPVKETPNQSELKHVCDICERKFSTKQGCSNHKSKAHVADQKRVNEDPISNSQDGFVCSVCGEVRNNEAGLAAHIEYKHEKGSYVCATCGEVRETALSLNAHIEFKHGNRLKRTLSEMRTKPKETVNRFLCTKCSLSFPLEGELADHITKHTTSPPNKRNRADIVEENTANKKDEDMDSEVTELRPDDKDEEMTEINKLEVKSAEARKPANIDAELNDCFDVISNIHECREEQFKLRYESMRFLKEEKNRKIWELTKIMEEVKLENATLNFIARTVDDPKLLEEVFEENTRLIKENKELVKTLELKKQTIF